MVSATTEESGLLSVVACVALFWTVITLGSMICRRLLLYLFEANTAVSCTTARGPPTFSPYRLNGLFGTLRFSKPLLLSLLDTVATFEVCACSLDCWPIRVVAGRTGLLTAIALNSVRSTIFVYRDAYGNPCTPWYRLLTGKSSQFWVGLTWLLQLLGAQAAYCCAKIWWSMRPTYAHAVRYELAQDPSRIPADLQVPMWQGFLIEGLGTFLEFYLAFVITFVFVQWNRHYRHRSSTRCSDSSPGDVLQETAFAKPEEYEQSRSQLLASFGIRLFISLYMTAQCLSLTGMYVNPANAFAHCWGVQTVPHFLHIVVYWLGPFFGVWLATQLQSQTVRVIEIFYPIGRYISIPPWTPRTTRAGTSHHTHSEFAAANE